MILTVALSQVFRAQATAVFRDFFTKLRNRSRSFRRDLSPAIQARGISASDTRNLLHVMPIIGGGSSYISGQRSTINNLDMP